MARYSLLQLLLLGVVTFVSAFPGNSLVSDAQWKEFDELNVNASLNLAVDKRATLNLPSLRILPLGASITWGYLSSTGNGYRKPLRDELRYLGYPVDMVGTKHNGNMVDNDVEAHIGDTISQVQTAAQGSLKFQPNVVLINAGTNDCLQNLDVGNAGSRMQSLLDLLWSNIQDTTIVLSTLIPCGDPSCTQSNLQSINTQYRKLVTTLQGQGKKIVLADMNPPEGVAGAGFLDLNTDFANPIHPNDQGYAKMAAIWYPAIQQAVQAGYISNPAQSYAISPSGNCDKKYGDGIYAGGLTQTGSGDDDGIYRHDSQSMGIVLTVESVYGDRGQWFFARLYDRSRDDFVGWYERSDGSQWYGVWRNTGDENNLYVKIADMNVVIPCIPEGVNFVDVNADGLDDMVCIGKDGSAYAAINQGNGDANNPPSFVDHGQIMAGMSGYPQAQVRLGDVDGDGRVDYCVFDPNGDMSCWRNGWVEDTPAYWQALGKRFTGRDMGNLTGVRLEDINGDGRDDWVWVGDTGEAYLETNSRSCEKGSPGDGLNIVWRQGFWQGQNSGPTYNGMGVSGVRERIHFARVYGASEAFGLLGRQDYVYLEHSKDGDKDKFDMHVWKNIGAGATKLKADGDKYCNMMGHSNGMMDYVWTRSTGQMTLYPNRGMTSVVNGGPSFWDAAVNIFDPSDWGMTLDRRDLHLTDWDGDGACDIVWVDPNNQNKPQVWINQYKSTGKWNWNYNANPAPELACKETRGVGIFDLPVQFADISGNGRGDYLCIEKDGRTYGWIHNSDDSWAYSSQFKYSEQKDRANLHWADVNGDGRADLIWTDKFSGDGWVWYNNGPKNVKGSTYEWVPQGALYMGNHAGSCMYYPDFLGNSRADMHSLTGTITNQAETWFNECNVDHIGDDQQDCPDPGLPVPPKPAWQQQTCSNPAITNIDENGADRWNALDTSDALNAAIYYWKQQQNGQTKNSFGTEIAAFFGNQDLSAGMNCESMAPQNGCGSTVGCDKVNAPAGMFILNSMIHLEQRLQNVYDGINSAESDAIAAVPQLSADFATLPSDGEASAKIALDILGLGLALVLAPFWNIWFKSPDGWESEFTGTIKDQTNAAVSYAITIAKDGMSGISIDYQNDLLTNIGNVTQAWAASVSYLDNGIFNGSDSAISQLRQYIEPGAFIQSIDLPSSQDIKGFLEKALYGYLIPHAWTYNTNGVFIANTTQDCSPHSLPDTVDNSNGHMAQATVCYNGISYYILQAKGDANVCIDNIDTGLECSPNDFVPPTGVERITGNVNDWGGLTVEDIVVGAINSYTNNGNKNGWKEADATDSDTISSINDLGVRAPGVVPVPICSTDEAWNNWNQVTTLSRDRTDNYPCN